MSTPINTPETLGALRMAEITMNDASASAAGASSLTIDFDVKNISSVDPRLLKDAVTDYFDKYFLLVKEIAALEPTDVAPSTPPSEKSKVLLVQQGSLETLDANPPFEIAGDKIWDWKCDGEYLWIIYQCKEQVFSLTCLASSAQIIQPTQHILPFSMTVDMNAKVKQRTQSAGPGSIFSSNSAANAKLQFQETTTLLAMFTNSPSAVTANTNVAAASSHTDVVLGYSVCAEPGNVLNVFSFVRSEKAGSSSLIIIKDVFKAYKPTCRYQETIYDTHKDSLPLMTKAFYVDDSTSANATMSGAQNEFKNFVFVIVYASDDVRILDYRVFAKVRRFTVVNNFAEPIKFCMTDTLPNFKWAVMQKNSVIHIALGEEVPNESKEKTMTVRSFAYSKIGSVQMYPLLSIDTQHVHTSACKYVTVFDEQTNEAKRLTSEQYLRHYRKTALINDVKKGPGVIRYPYFYYVTKRKDKKVLTLALEYDGKFVTRQFSVDLSTKIPNEYRISSIAIQDDYVFGVGNIYHEHQQRVSILFAPLLSILQEMIPETESPNIYNSNKDTDCCEKEHDHEHSHENVTVHETKHETASAVAPVLDREQNQNELTDPLPEIKLDPDWLVESYSEQTQIDKQRIMINQWNIAIVGGITQASHLLDAKSGRYNIYTLPDDEESNIIWKVKNGSSNLVQGKLVHVNIGSFFCYCERKNPKYLYFLDSATGDTVVREVSLKLAREGFYNVHLLYTTVLNVKYIALLYYTKNTRVKVLLYCPETGHWYDNYEVIRQNSVSEEKTVRIKNHVFGPYNEEIDKPVAQTHEHDLNEKHQPHTPVRQDENSATYSVITGASQSQTKTRDHNTMNADYYTSNENDERGMEVVSDQKTDGVHDANFEPQQGTEEDEEEEEEEEEEEKEADLDNEMGMEGTAETGFEPEVRSNNNIVYDVGMNNMDHGMGAKHGVKLTLINTDLQEPKAKNPHEIITRNKYVIYKKNTVAFPNNPSSSPMSTILFLVNGQIERISLEKVRFDDINESQ